MPDFPDHTQQEQGASDMLPPFFAPRARPRRVTPPGPAGAGRSRLAPLFTPPGVRRQLGAAPESEELSAADAAHGPVVEAASTPVPFAPEAEVEVAASDVAAPMEWPAPAEGESSSTASTPNYEGGFAGGAEGEDLALDAYPDAAEPLVGHEPGTWPVVVDHAHDAVLAVGGDGVETDVDRLELEREQWLPEAKSDSLVEVESFWAAEPVQSAPDQSAHLEHASDVDLVQEGEREVYGLTDPDGSSLAMASIDTVHVEATTDDHVEQPTIDAPTASSELTAGDELTEALAWPNESRSQPADGLSEAPATPAEQALADAAPELRDSAAPWADEGDGAVSGSESDQWASEAQPSPEPFAAASVTDTEPERAVAEALDRVAQRIRDGELTLPTDAGAATDEGALALVLAALLRGGSRG